MPATLFHHYLAWNDGGYKRPYHVLSLVTEGVLVKEDSIPKLGGLELLRKWDLGKDHHLPFLLAFTLTSMSSWEPQGQGMYQRPLETMQKALSTTLSLLSKTSHQLSFFKDPLSWTKEKMSFLLYLFFFFFLLFLCLISNWQASFMHVSVIQDKFLYFLWDAIHASMWTALFFFFSF